MAIDLKQRQKDIREKYRPVAVEKDLAEGLKELRRDVENQGRSKIVLVGQVYRDRMLDEVRTLNYHPWEIGYKVESINIHEGFFRRSVFIKIKGADILEVPEREIEPIMGAVTQELLEIGNDMPEITHIAKDCIRIDQQFAVMFWHEGNPNIVVPGGPK